MRSKLIKTVYFIIIILDFKKAFTKVLHWSLNKKLQYLGEKNTKVAVLTRMTKYSLWHFHESIVEIPYIHITKKQEEP